MVQWCCASVVSNVIIGGKVFLESLAVRVFRLSYPSGVLMWSAVRLSKTSARFSFRAEVCFRPGRIFSGFGPPENLEMPAGLWGIR